MGNCPFSDRPCRTKVQRSIHRFQPILAAGKEYELQPHGCRVSAQGMFANGAAAFSRVSGHAWLRLCEKLQYSTGGLLQSWSAGFPRTHDEPIRAELFGIDRLEQHAESLAAAQYTTSKPTTDRLLEARLRDNDRALRTAYRATIATVRQARAATPAAEWLLDNFHLVEEQVRAIRIDLPPGFHRQLPKLIDGPLKGYTRTYFESLCLLSPTGLGEPERPVFQDANTDVPKCEISISSDQSTSGHDSYPNTAKALLHTFSAVKPYSRITTSPGADAP